MSCVVNAGLMHGPDEVDVSYGSDSWQRLRERLHEFTARELADVAGVSIQYIRAIRNGDAEPSTTIKRSLVSLIIRAG